MLFLRVFKCGVNERTIRRDMEEMRYVQKISKDKLVTIQMYNAIKEDVMEKFAQENLDNLHGELPF